jgi:magnesium-transporting ATPase (P-type)
MKHIIEIFIIFFILIIGAIIPLLYIPITISLLLFSFLGFSITVAYRDIKNWFRSLSSDPVPKKKKNGVKELSNSERLIKDLQDELDAW